MRAVLAESEITKNIGLRCPPGFYFHRRWIESAIHKSSPAQRADASGAFEREVGVRGWRLPVRWLQRQRRLSRSCVLIQTNIDGCELGLRNDSGPGTLRCRTSDFYL